MVEDLEDSIKRALLRIKELVSKEWKDFVFLDLPYLGIAEKSRDYPLDSAKKRGRYDTRYATAEIMSDREYEEDRERRFSIPFP